MKLKLLKKKTQCSKIADSPREFKKVEECSYALDPLFLVGTLA
jgi:hypothetical protein